MARSIIILLLASSVGAISRPWSSSRRDAAAPRPAPLRSRGIGPSIQRMRVEYLPSPITVDEPSPRFSWATAHSTRGASMIAYRVTVTSTNGSLMWDSGRVGGNSSLNIAYGGAALLSDSDYAWSATWWDNFGVPSPSSTSTFSTALFSPNDWNGAQWLAAANVASDNTFRADFTLPPNARITRARLYIAGLGFYKSWMNGVPVSDHAVGPFTTFQLSVLYDAHDVAALLTPGCNSIGVMLGNGWYAESSIHAGNRTLLLMLSVDDAASGSRLYFTSSTNGAGGDATVAAEAWAGAILPQEYIATHHAGAASSRVSVKDAAVFAGGVSVTPLTFTTAPGPVTSDGIYDGESYDARLLQAGWDTCSFTNASAWTPAVASQTPPTGMLRAQTILVRVDETYPPTSISQPQAGVYVFDFGQNMAGLTQLQVCGAPPGTVITAVYGEDTTSLGLAYNWYVPGNAMLQTYTTSGATPCETYTSLFTQYAFRYVEVHGLPSAPSLSTLTAFFIHADVPQVGTFSCSNEDVNTLNRITRYAALSNLMSVPTDCPQRERRGWLGDAQLAFETEVHYVEMSAFHTKWMRDVSDAQLYANMTNEVNGSVPDTAPFYHHGGLPGDPGWQIAYGLISYGLNDFYADDNVVAEHYSGIKWMADAFNRQAAPFNGQLKYQLYGDWCSAVMGLVASPSLKTADIPMYWHVTALDIVSDFASQLGNDADAAEYAATAAATRVLYQNILYNASSATYANGTTLNQALALQLGVVPLSEQSKVIDAMLASVHNSLFPDHMVGGIVGTKHIWPMMEAVGAHDLAMTMLLQRDQPSFLYWVDEGGATTLWENWPDSHENKYGSANHIMYGGLGHEMIMQSIAGVRRVPGARSWTSLLIAPPIPFPGNTSAAVTWSTYSLDTPMGPVAVAWYMGGVAECTQTYAYANASLQCRGLNGAVGAGGATFTSVDFASFGIPTGTCGAFAATPSCDYPTSASVLSTACVGSAACSVAVDPKAFGAAPATCSYVNLRLYAQLSGPSCAVTAASITLTVPVSGTAAVVLPTFGFNPSYYSVVEADSNTPVWVNGAFTPGAAGVSNAYLTSDNAVRVEVGSGDYTLQLLALPAAFA